MHPAALPIEELLAACELQFTRRSGPGGQNRNKVETAVVLTHRPTGLTAQASEQRTQAENRAQALQRLRLKLAVEHRQAPLESVTSLWQQRTHKGRIAVSADHVDFPAVLAEALDHLTAHSFLPGPAAQALAVSSSQLIGLLRQHPPALALLNKRRAESGKPPLK